MLVCFQFVTVVLCLTNTECYLILFTILTLHFLNFFKTNNLYVNIFRGICSSKKEVLNKIETLLPDLAEAYETIFRESQQQSREFFGLRDFYRFVLLCCISMSKRYNYILLGQGIEMIGFWTPLIVGQGHWDGHA